MRGGTFRFGGIFGGINKKQNHNIPVNTLPVGYGSIPSLAPPSAFRWCKSRESKQETRLVRVFCCLGFITPSRKPNHAWPSDSTWSPLTASRQNTPPALNHRLNGIRPRPPEIGSDSLDTRPAIGFNEKALWQAALPWVNLRAFGLLAKVTDRDARTIRAPSRSAPHPSPE